MLVLASASPRRRDLLTQAGLEFRVETADVSEAVEPGEDAAAYVLRLAEAKALAVWTRLRGETSAGAGRGGERAGDAGAGSVSGLGSVLGLSPVAESVPLVGDGNAAAQTKADPLIVLGADTCVMVNGEILGKPTDQADARRMLEMLSGRTHSVMTGIAALTEHESFADVEITQVTFHVIGERELVRYLASGEPMDKAGAYGIQGFAARWIPRIEGCYFNVVGLPIARTMALIAQATSATGGTPV